MSSLPPPEPCRPWFLQRYACAYADDFALATASLRESLPKIQDALSTVDSFTGMSTKSSEVSLDAIWELDDTTALGMGRHPRPSPPANADQGPVDHRWTKARNKFVGVCARIRTSSQNFVQRLVSFKIYAPTVLSFIGSVAEPDAASTLRLKLWRFKKLSAGTFHFLPSALAWQCMWPENSSSRHSAHEQGCSIPCGFSVC